MLKNKRALKSWIVIATTVLSFLIGSWFFLRLPSTWSTWSFLPAWLKNELEGQSQSQLKEQFEDRLQDHQKIEAQLGDSPILNLEVVTEPQSIAQGLSGRSELGSDGLLFIFPRSEKHVFWMKEMQFGLDLIWLRDNEIIEITPQVPPPLPTTPLEDLPTYQPDQPVDMVLEVVAGQAKQWNLQTGDLLRFETVL